MARGSRRGAHRPVRRVRPGLLVICAVALLATAGIRVVGSGDDAEPPGGAPIGAPVVATTTPRPAGVDGAPDRNPFGTPGGPATSVDPETVVDPGAAGEPAAVVDPVDDVAARVAPGS